MKAIASPNIALIKYWGKLPSDSDETRNLATNPSISMTLARAQTTVETSPAHGDFECLLNGAPASSSDRAKMMAHVRRVESELGRSLPPLRLDSRNNFPLGAGLASSSSSFAALTLALVGEALGLEAAQELLRRDLSRVSSLARRGSGSACRSVAGGFMKWEGESARSLEVDWPLRDTIVIFSRDKKSVSSTDGHAAAISSPRFPTRLSRLPDRIAAVETALKSRDFQRLGALIEEEALEMHEIARSGRPPVDYLLPETRRFLDALGPSTSRDFFFTIDAGPNLHFLSDRDISAELEALLSELGLVGEIWADACGPGPRLLA